MSARSRLAVLVLAASATLLISFPAHGGPALRVNTMPDRYAWQGEELILWGSAEGAGPLSYTWSFGDGSPPVSGPVSQDYYIPATHTYTNRPGETFSIYVATLTVSDGVEVASDRVKIGVIDPAALTAKQLLQVRVDIAIEEGLRWLYLVAMPYVVGELPLEDNDFTLAAFAEAVLAYEIQGHLPTNDPDEDIYTDLVRVGLDYTFSHAQTEAMEPQPAGDPDTDGDGLGLAFTVDGSLPLYTTGIAMTAIVASGCPDCRVEIPGSLIDGWLYREVIRDAVDYLAYAQNEAHSPEGHERGGWRYQPNHDSSDNSVSQWPVLGLIYAAEWGVEAPAFVRTELAHWIGHIQDPSDGDENDGGSWYLSGRGTRINIAMTAALLLEMYYSGDDKSTARARAAIDYISRNWEVALDNSGKAMNKGSAGNSYKTNYYAMYGVERAFRLFEIQYINPLDDPAGLDWYEDYASFLVAAQNEDGSWPDGEWTLGNLPGSGSILATIWAILILTPTPLFPEEPLLLAEKVDALVHDADGDGLASPGDTLEYTITIENLGEAAALDVTFTDSPDSNTTLVPGSLNLSGCPGCDGALGPPVTVAIGLLPPGAGVTIVFRVEINTALPPGTFAVADQGLVFSTNSPPVLTDDPDYPGEEDPTQTLVSHMVCIVDPDGHLFSAGDVNQDGRVDLADARLVADFALGLELPETALQRYLADLAPPFGVLDIRDAVMIAEIALGLRPGCPGASEASVMAFPLECAANRPVRLTLGEHALPVGGRGIIQISSDRGLGGLQVGPLGALTFDPAVLEVEGLKAVPPYRLLASAIDNLVGEVRFLLISEDEWPGSGPVLALEAKVKAIGPGSGLGGRGASLLRLRADLALDPSGRELIPQAEEGLVLLLEGLVLEGVRALPLPGGQLRFVALGRGITALEVRAFDLSGREVFTSGWVLGASLEWNLLDRRGKAVANGVYLYLIRVRGVDGKVMASGVRKVLVLR